MMLLSRGIAEGIAAQFVRQYDPRRIRRQVGPHDRQRATGGDLMTHREMLRWCEANGGLHRTDEFEVVKQPDGQTLFRPPVTAR